MPEYKKDYEYAVESVYDRGGGQTNKRALQELLDKYSNEGWRLAHVFTNELGKNEARVLGINVPIPQWTK